jgi:hypothetical protein
MISKKKVPVGNNILRGLFLESETNYRLQSVPITNTLSY